VLLALRLDDDRLERGPRREAAAVRRPLVEDRERVAEREVLAEGEEELLVVPALDLALRVGRDRGVEPPVAVAVGPVEHRAEDRRDAEARREAVAEEVALGREVLARRERRARLAPDDELRALRLELGGERLVAAEPLARVLA